MMNTRPTDDERCARSAPDRQRPLLGRGDLASALGYLGASVLSIGLFLPCFEVSGVGRVNYFWNGYGDGVAMLLLVLGSVGALVARRPWALWLTGVSSLVVTAFTLLRVMVQSDVSATELQWGWPVLFIGGALLLGSAEVGRRDGAAMPRALWDVVVATSLALAAIVVGPDVLSGTQKAVQEFQATKKIEERERWVPHASARKEMASVIANVQRDEGERSEHLEEERALENERRLRAEARRVAAIRLVADIRRWYPDFAESLRPVLDARQAFLESYEAGGLDSARPTCAAVAEKVRAARERLQRGPEPVLHGVTVGLFDLYLASAQACRHPAGPSIALSDLERTEERIGTQLRVLSASLAAYCLALPATGAGVSGDPGSILACDPRDRSARLE